MYIDDEDYSWIIKDTLHYLEQVLILQVKALLLSHDDEGETTATNWDFTTG